MNETTERFDQLERQVRRLRMAVMVLAMALLAIFTLGAAGSDDAARAFVRDVRFEDDAGESRVIVELEGHPRAERTIETRLGETVDARFELD